MLMWPINYHLLDSELMSKHSPAAKWISTHANGDQWDNLSSQRSSRSGRVKREAGINLEPPGLTDIKICLPHEAAHNVWARSLLKLRCANRTVLVEISISIPPVVWMCAWDTKDQTLHNGQQEKFIKERLSIRLKNSLNRSSLSRSL